jgi:hypothetical protein
MNYQDQRMLAAIGLGFCIAFMVAMIVVGLVVELS